MEKMLKRVRIIAIVIIMLLIIAIGFFGVYAKNKGIWSNVLPKYNLGMELAGYQELHFELDTTEETKNVYVDENGNYKGDVLEDTSSTTEDSNVAKELDVDGKYKVESRTIRKNDPSKINIENFEKTKKIIQNRLEKYDSYEYNIRQDSVTGKIVLELPDDEDLDLKLSLVSTIGKISFVDSKTGLILLDDTNLKMASPYTRTNENGEYEVYLQLDFDEVGKEILKDMTAKYVPVVDAEGNTTTPYVEVRLDNQPMISTHFQEAIETGTVHVPMGNVTTDITEYNELFLSVSEIASLINEENLPLQYVLTDEVSVQSRVTNNEKIIATIVYAVLTVIVSLYMIIKYKTEGLRQALFSIAYVAALSIVFRYTNVLITYNSLIALFGIIVINYIFAIKLLNKLKTEENRKVALKETLKELYLTIIPVCIVAVIFTFMSAAIINSVGTTIFWGLLVQLLFSLITLV